MLLNFYVTFVSAAFISYVANVLLANLLLRP